MKKSLLVIGAIALVLFLSAISLPFLFKDRIQLAVNDAINKSVNAEISYEDFSLSILRSFPNLSFSVNKLSVVGNEPFEGDTLIVANEMAVSLNLFKALFSDKLVISKIYLDHPKLLIQLLEDGSANYDIAVETDTVSAEPTSFDFGINKWTVDQGSIIYNDMETGFYLELIELDHVGNGDFTQDLFDLNTNSKGRLVSMKYEELEYLGNKQLQADIILQMDLPQSKYTFKQNQVAINQFSFSFAGWVSLPEQSEDILMDLTFETKENSLKNLLSCVPGMYNEGFENIESSGQITLNGNLNGTYNEQQIPAFNLFLNIIDGRFQYPDLPTSVENINLDLLLANEDGNPENTLIDISKLHIDFGKSPVDGRFRIDGLATPHINAELSAALNLEELNSMFPMDQTTIRGRYEISLNANGTYDSLKQIFPVVDASMKLTDGFIKTTDFPDAIDQFNLISTVSNKSGKIPDTRIDVSDFNLSMDNEKFSGKLTLINPSDYSWDLDVTGGVDLEKISHVLSLEDMELAGIIRGNLMSKGKLSSLEKEEYYKIPTSGKVSVQDFKYSSSELAHPLGIGSGSASFTPQSITLSDVEVQSGSTDITINGGLTNYINYIFQEHASVAGKLESVSNNINLNEWMTESAETENSESLSVLEIPGNIDFQIKSQAGTVYYDNMVLENITGTILINNGIAQLQDLNFNSLGGTFNLNGSYDPRDLRHPEFNFAVNMKDIGFQEAFRTFNTVKLLAPITQVIKGNFTSNFALSGELQQDMMPALSTINGKGLVNIATAALSAADSKLVKGFTELTQFAGSPSKFDLKDVVMAMKIEDGKLKVSPFTAEFGGYKTVISGSTGIDGSLDFLLNMDVPAGVVGSSVNQAIANLTSSNAPVDDKVNLSLKLTGDYSNPSFGLGGVQGGNTTAGLARSAVQEKTEQSKDSAKALVKAESDKLSKKAQTKLDSLISDQISDSTTSDNVKNTAKELIKKDNVDEVINIFKRKKAKQPADSVKQ